MKTIYEKNKHLLPFAFYMLVYLSWFAWLEDRYIWRYQVIHVPVDDLIPFCEPFVLPYFLWFAYIPAVVLYLAWHDRDGYYKSAIFLCTGMTVFLVVSTLFPNGHHLRPVVMPRDNIFSHMVMLLYRTDTPTNLWPSIHVYNSLGAHIALCGSQLGKRRGIRLSSLLLCVSIVLSTMLLKQHSFFDVATAFVMTGVMYVLVYRCDLLYYLRQFRSGMRERRSRRAAGKL